MDREPRRACHFTGMQLVLTRGNTLAFRAPAAATKELLAFALNSRLAQSFSLFFAGATTAATFVQSKGLHL